MREFWVASGHHLTRRADHGGLVATPELIMADLARPELMPPADACDAERNLHASLLADPPLTSVHVHCAALGQAAADSMLQMLREPGSGLPLRWWTRVSPSGNP